MESSKEFRDTLARDLKALRNIPGGEKEREFAQVLLGHAQSMSSYELAKKQHIEQKKSLLNQNNRDIEHEKFNKPITINDKAWVYTMRETYKDQANKLEKIDAIKFYETAIEVGGVKFARENMEAEPNNKDIFQRYDGGKEYLNEFYFTWDAAVREAQVQGKRIPTKQDFEKAAQACPGDYYADDWCIPFKELSFLLGLKFGGCRSLKGSWDKCGRAYIWSSSAADDPVCAWGICCGSEGGIDWYHSNYSFPVRLLHD